MKLRILYIVLCNNAKPVRFNAGILSSSNLGERVILILNQLKRINVLFPWLILVILLTVASPSYGYDNETDIQTVLLAESLIGKPYVPGGNTPEKGFDSIGFIQYIYKEGENIVLPRSPSQLWKLGKPIERSEIQPGDVLFFNGSNNMIAAIYTGDDIMIVVSTTEGVVERNIVQDSYWRERYKGARRYTDIAEELNPAAQKALELVGSPYKPGGNDPNGFDHSGFVQYVFSNIYKLDFPRTSNEQWRIGMEVDPAHLDSGDVLFFQGSDVLLPGIHIDNGIFVIVTTTGVAALDLETSDYWNSRLLGARRFARGIIESSAAVNNPIVQRAMELIDTPYNPVGNSPSEGFNTTNFVRYVYKDVLGIQLPVLAERIYEMGGAIFKQDLQPGDLVFFQGNSLIPGIYKGNGRFIVQTTEGVMERDLESAYWSGIYKVAKRLTEEDIYYLQPENHRNHDKPVIQEAIKYLGTPYLLRGETPEGFDCSYLIQTVFRDAKKAYLPRITYKQWEVGETINFEDKVPGDVLYFSEVLPEDGESHHGAIYLGGNYIIHASYDERMTTISYLGQNLLDKLVVVKRFDSLSLRLDEKVVEEAYKTLGTPYLAGGNTPEGFNHSGFIQYVMKAGLGIDLPRYSSQQWALGTEIAREDLKIGDVLFFEGSSKILLPGLYIGNGQFFIVTESEGVAIRDLNVSGSYWNSRYVGTRRYEKITE